MGTALQALRKHRLPAVPVIAAQPPVRLAEVLGTIREDDIAEFLAQRRATLDDPVRAHLSPPPPFTGIGQPLSRGLAALRRGGVVLVLDGGLVSGMVTGEEILDCLSESES